MNKVYLCTSLTGGGDGALDAIDGLNLRDGDKAIVFTSTNTYSFNLDDDSAAAESSPDTIKPDSNAGDKRWIRTIIAIDAVTNATTVDAATTVTNATTVTAADNVETGTTVTTGTNVEAATTVTTGTNVVSADVVTTGTNVENATTVTTGTNVGTATTVTTGTNVEAATTVTAADSVDAATTVATATTVDSATTVTNSTTTNQYSGTFVDEGGGGLVSDDTALDVDSALAEDAWESVGPTGSGADNIWAGLDSVPSDVDWIEVSFYAQCSVVGSVENTLCNASICARKNGSSLAWTADETWALLDTEIVTSSGRAYCFVINSCKIPVASGVIFDLYYAIDTFTAVNLKAQLVGYGYNM